MKIIRVLLPILVVAAGLVGSALLVKFGKETEPEDPPTIRPVVETVTVELRDHQFVVRAQGNVSAGAEIDLTAEVAGKVEWIAYAMAAGGFFDKGDDLVRIEKRDFELAVVAAEAQLTQARATLVREEAEANVAMKEWQELGSGEASPLLKREPQLAQARAVVDSARAMVEKAERDLARCVVKAPFDGRVERKAVDAGQFVNRGMSLGRLYSVDHAEVRLPIPEEDLAFLELPLAYGGESVENAGPKATLSGSLGGRFHVWEGSIVRTEGRIDTRSRMIYAVARVDDPYHRRSKPAANPPPAVGLFVDCEIEGRTDENTTALPRRALRSRDEVWVVDAEGRLRLRKVVVLRAGRSHVVVGSGLEAGERVIVSSLDAVVEGMAVRVAGEDPTPAAEADGQEVVP